MARYNRATRVPSVANGTSARRVARALAADIRAGSNTEDLIYQFPNSTSFSIYAETEPVEATVSASIYWTYSGAGGSEDVNFGISDSSGYTFDWGDGNTTTSNTALTYQTVSHTFPAGTYSCKFTPVNAAAVIEFDLFNWSGAGGLPDPARFSGIQKYRMSGNNFTGPMPSFLNNNSLTYLQITYDTSLAGTLFPSITHLNSTLTRLYVYESDLIGTVPDLSNFSALTAMDVRGNNLTSYDGASFNTSLDTIGFGSCAISDSDEIDRILDITDQLNTSNGTLALDGGTNAIPSAAGLTSKSNLEGRGWTVSVNS